MRPAAAFAVLALVGVVASAEARPRRKGKIVRVERSRTGGHGVPRLCNFNPSDSTANCFGLAPDIGDVATILSTEGLVGTARVRRVESQAATGAMQSACTNGLWRIEVELSGVDPKNPNALSWSSWLLFDLDLTPESKLVDPPAEMPGGSPNETAAVTVDRDGAAPADFLVTWYTCPGAPGATGAVQTFCIDYWDGDDLGGRAHWTRSRQDVVTWCN